MGTINFLRFLDSSNKLIGLLPLISVISGVIMCILVIISSKKGCKEPDCIRILDDNYVSAVFDGNEYFWSFAEIYKVMNKDDCYLMKVKNIHHVSFIVCQKDLLTCGTLSEFEKVFSSKLL
jgi:hypothetical protein